MPDFINIRSNLSATRREQHRAKEAVFATTQKISAIERELQSIARFAADDDSHYRQRIGELQKLMIETHGRNKDARAGLDATNALSDGYLQELLPFLTDPQKGVENLSDEKPILMFPLRLETRFKKVPDDRTGALRDELWVRVYPDDCVIDTFEELLSESEWRSATIFWTEMWKAGGIEGQERSAWRGLVAAHGSGRAGWIYAYPHYQPRNTGDKPVKADPDDVLLVIVQRLKAGEANPFSAGEQTAATQYWSAVWRSEGRASEEQAAWNALVASVGAGRANEIATQFKPVNLEEQPGAGKKKNEVAVQTAVLILPSKDELDLRLHAWSRAPEVRMMPERLVLIGDGAVLATGALIPAALVVGPNPSLPKDDPDNIARTGENEEDLVLGNSLKWLTDFEEAVRAGMGFKVALTPAQADRGFGRLLVAGVRLSADDAEGKDMLTALIENHRNGASGFALLPQGAPTNNTESKNAAFTRSDDPDMAFDLVFGKNQPLRPDPVNDSNRWDGDWLAHWLGLAPGAFDKTLYASGTDQSEARAMNVALWPATIGYLMDSMMQEVFDEDIVLKTRSFFTRYVSGRGPVPAIRIGRQPYGILPAARFSGLTWMRRRSNDLSRQTTRPPFLLLLYNVLQRMTATWDALAGRGDWVGKEEGDPHQILLNILGLHPSSVEFYNRNTPGLDFYWNLYTLANVNWSNGIFNFGRRRDVPETPDFARGLERNGMELLNSFGYASSDIPAILQKIFQANADLLKGPVVDDRPLSETEPVRIYATENRNYIQWLMDASASPEILRKEEGFIDGVRPAALLYLMLHKALLEGFFDAGLRMYGEKQLADAVVLRRAKTDAPFIFIKEKSGRESKFEWLYAIEPAIGDRLVIDEIASNIDSEKSETRYLTEQLKALEHLKNVPTARLERVFAEHIDCCSYRLDAWKQGLLHCQLEGMRAQTDKKENPAGGVYIGAYGWLENVRPENKVLNPVPLEGDLARTFNRDDEPLLVADASNAGHILAPSLNHAVTAAVLRNGYLSNASPNNPDTLAVNLSSERVRQALAILEGIRNGQSLGALLGYRLERSLHDRYDEANNIFLDEVIFDLRRAFPLYGNQLTQRPADEPEEAIEARNVVNGLDLINHIKKTGNRSFPFGIETLQTATLSDAEIVEINKAVDDMLNVHDAVADVATSEAVYQVVLGNYERAGATLDAYGKGNFPPEPEVVQTPRTGVTLTHRTGIHLNPDATPPAGATPRAQAEPALNEWLAIRLPDLDKIGCNATYFGAATPTFVSALDLGLQPIDLLYLINTEKDEAMTELDDRIEHYIRTNPAPDARSDEEINIKYTDRVDGKFTFFEVAPLLSSLRVLLLQSRPLKPGDLLLHEEASRQADEQVSLPGNRLAVMSQFLNTNWNDNSTGLKKRFRDIESAMQTRYANRTQLQKNIDNPAPGDDIQDLKNQLTSVKNDIVAHLDAMIGDMIALLLETGAYGIAETGVGIIYDEKRRILKSMLQKASDYHLRWTEKLGEFDNRIAEFEILKADPTASEFEQTDLLRRAERAVSTTFVSGNTVADLEMPVKDKRTPFLNKLNALDALIDTSFHTLQGLKQAIEQFLSNTPTASGLDLLSIDIQEEINQMLTLGEDLMNRAGKLSFELNKDESDADKESLARKIAAKLDEHNSAADAGKKVQSLTEAAQMMFGADFRLIPAFAVSSQQTAEWTNALSQSGQLLDFQKKQLDNAFPEDDWLHGVARVREKMWHWENMALLSDAFGRSEPEIKPIQIPVKENDRWLALQYRLPTETGEDFKGPEADCLLYTAHYYSETLDKSRVCGLLLDEWTEVIPNDTETAGVVFHYDRPNTEPPQAWLLVMPSDFRGAWQWDDIIGALNETLDEAKRRVVEPAFVDDTAFAHFLPATMSGFGAFPVNIMLNYAFNNEVFQYINIENNG